MRKPSNHDEYIAAAADFAVPILEKIRKAVHKACPGVEECMKWGTPHFAYAGLLVGMAAFKEHAHLGFWRGRELSDPEGLLTVVGRTGIGVLRLEKLADLPTQRVLVSYVKEAVKLNEDLQQRAKAAKPAGKKQTKKKSAVERSIAVPPDLAAALKKRKKAAATFEGLSYSHRKEYVEWLNEAKRAETREKRLATALQWLAEGKPRNWKYMKEWG